MGILEQTATRQRFILRSRSTLGRHAGCHVQVEDARVSGEHAVLYWRGNCWELKDLGSHNGTFFQGQRLDAKDRPRLKAGDSFLLAPHGPTFQLVDDGPPLARARNVATQEVRETAGSLLVLPSDETPEASVFPDPEGKWVLETNDAQRMVADGEVVSVGQTEWHLELPAIDAETLDAQGPSVEAVHLRLGVDRSQEHVEVTVLYGGEQHTLPPRANHYLLVVLARLLLEDTASEAERGWVDREQLCRMLATDSNRLNVDIHRIRRQMSGLGIQGAAGVIERRVGAGQLRLGLRRVEVYSM